MWTRWWSYVSVAVVSVATCHVVMVLALMAVVVALAKVAVAVTVLLVFLVAVVVVCLGGRVSCGHGPCLSGSCRGPGRGCSCSHSPARGFGCSSGCMSRWSHVSWSWFLSSSFVAVVVVLVVVVVMVAVVVVDAVRSWLWQRLWPFAAPPLLWRVFFTFFLFVAPPPYWGGEKSVLYKFSLHVPHLQFVTASVC